MKKRVVILPNTNTFSHVARAMALADWLASDGWEPHIGLGRSRHAWASRFNPHCHEVPALWEPSGHPFPCIPWFADREHIENCVRARESLIRGLRPHLVISIFDYTAAIACDGVPLLTINGACMLPLFRDMLGFDGPPQPAWEGYRVLLDGFWRSAARAFAPSLQRRKRAPKQVLSELLVGDMNLIYEIEEICGLGPLPAGYHLIGPVLWDGWEKTGSAAPAAAGAFSRTVYVNSGTLTKTAQVTQSLVDLCRSLGARVLASTGEGGWSESSPSLFCRPFLSPSGATQQADVVICAGGTGACYANLYYGAPSLVIPLQPEQATNGINIERAGCGRVLTRNLPFFGTTQAYENAFESDRTRDVLAEMLKEGRRRPELARVQTALHSCNTRERLLQQARDMI